MTEPSFSVNDRRGNNRTQSGLFVGNQNTLDSEVKRLKQAGYPGLPKSETRARSEAITARTAVENRSLISAMERRRQATANRMRLEGQSLIRTAGGFGGTQGAGSNIQMALPKVRQPMSTLVDKQIPFDISNPEELKEIRRWARLFYTTHDLVPLLVDIYAKFPLIGLEFTSDDNQLVEFWNNLFFNELDYETFLPEQLGREFHISGEVTTLTQFNEELGTWASEEVLDPDLIRVSHSIFLKEERVQLMPKAMVDQLRMGPMGKEMTNETPSEKLERNREWRQLLKYFPEVIDAANSNDGIDISDALVSRIVNKTIPWADRGTPHMLRSFRTLMMEESLNAAQDAIADRLYAPLILAKLGVPNLGDGQPWIPDQSDLDAARNDLQMAIASDFRLFVTNFAIDVTNAFGREVVPRFDADYDRIEAKLLQAWGIGQALIMGGTGGGGTYASSAINREFVTQMMMNFQKHVKQHIIKRMEPVAEAQEFYEYEQGTFVPGLKRSPVWKEIMRVDEETGERHKVKVPKLKLADINFATLNLRDEAQERQFLQNLRQAGVPLSDRSMMVNIDVRFEDELSEFTNENFKKHMAQSQEMQKVVHTCKMESTPVPPEVIQYFAASDAFLLQHEQRMLAQEQANIAAAQVEMANEQTRTQFDQIHQNGAGGGMPAPPNGQPSGDASGPQAGSNRLPPVEIPRNNQSRPAESDEMQATAAKDGKRSSILTRGPSSYGRSHFATAEQVEAAIRRREIHSNPTPEVEDLVYSDHFWSITGLEGHEGEVQADWGDIKNGADTPTKKILEEALEIYEMLTGASPQW